MKIESEENISVLGITQISTMEDPEFVLKPVKGIVYDDQLLKLASIKIDDKCMVK